MRGLTEWAEPLKGLERSKDCIEGLEGFGLGLINKDYARGKWGKYQIIE